MSATLVNIDVFFRAPANGFWHWADDGQVIEWQHGVTICYRDELAGILRELQLDGQISLDLILLIIAACQDSFERSAAYLTLTEAGIDASLETGQSWHNNEEDDQLVAAVSFLDNIRQLPAELRKGPARLHLLREVLGGFQSQEASQFLRMAADELHSGRINDKIILPGSHILREEFLRDIISLEKQFKRFNTAAALEQWLRTGLTATPQPPDISLPEAVAPLSLFEQLLEDNKTAGVASLARRIIAALNIPMHTRDSGEQPLGGIADITNRGNFDKLLLSELAHDDAILMARLVNNEALYYRREVPPENPKRQRIVLTDATLRLWGMPRVFALSAALACIHNTRPGQPAKAFVLPSKYYTEVDLRTKEGILRAMEMMDHGLHCGTALTNVLKDVSDPAAQEIIFITTPESLHDPAFQAMLAGVRHLLSFIITVSRSGQLQLSAVHKGMAQLMLTAKFNLEELLFTPAVRKSGAVTNIEVPEFFRRDRPPILMPKVRMQASAKHYYYEERLGLLLINPAQRVMLLQSSRYGARELLPFIEKGNYYFGHIRRAELYILVVNEQKPLLKFYYINTETYEVNEVDLSATIPFTKSISQRHNDFYFLAGPAMYFYDAATRQSKQMDTGLDNTRFITLSSPGGPISANKEDPYAHITHASYSHLFNVDKVYTNSNGELVLGKHRIEFTEQTYVILRQNRMSVGDKYASRTAEHPQYLKNSLIKFDTHVWQDGSYAVIDGRGLLHLVSADKYLPQITIPLIIGNTTACWSSDGYFCGSEHFLDPTVPLQKISVQDFYNKYILAFFQHLA